MRTRRLLCNTLLLAALGIAAPDLSAQDPAAQASPLAGSWALDAERSQDPYEVMAAARGGSGAVMRRGGAGADSTVARRAGSAGSGGGRVVIRGGGPIVMSILQSGQRMRIELTAEHVTLHIDDAPPFTLPLSGEAAEITRWDQQVLARARLANDTLTIETTAANDVLFREVFAATQRGEVDAELHVTLPVLGGGQQQPIVVRRVYTAVR